MKTVRGMTIFEITIAFGILLTVIVAVWALLAGANRQQEGLWDELAASELAASALEHAFAAKVCEPTPPQGTPVRLTPADGGGAAPPSDMATTLYITPVAGRADLLLVRAVVTWDEHGVRRSLERTTRRRATP